VFPPSSARYRELRDAHPLDEVSFGACAVRLVDVDQLPGAQVGYAVDPAGESLAGEGDGDWRAEWLVVGYEDLNGDPLFADTSVDDWPVYTAAHGEGAWEPVRIADSFSRFVEALELVRAASVGREHPVALEANPLPPRERARILREVRSRNPASELDFWELWLGDE
jgi:hypothetical protein